MNVLSGPRYNPRGRKKIQVPNKQTKKILTIAENFKNFILLPKYFDINQVDPPYTKVPKRHINEIANGKNNATIT